MDWHFDDHQENIFKTSDIFGQQSDNVVQTLNENVFFHYISMTNQKYHKCFVFGGLRSPWEEGVTAIILWIAWDWCIVIILIRKAMFEVHIVNWIR